MDKQSVMVFLKVDYGFACHSYLCSENKNNGDLFKRLTNFSNPLSFFVLKNIFSTLEKKFRTSVRSFNCVIGGLQPISRDKDNNAAMCNSCWTNKRS